MDRAYDVGEIPRDSLQLTYMESGVDPAILKGGGGGGGGRDFSRNLK